MRQRILLALSILALALLQGCGGSSYTSPNRLRVGLLLDDNLPSVRDASQRAAGMAAAKINAAGGVLVGGKPVDLTLVPMLVSDPTSTRSAIWRLAAQGVTFLIGPASSGNAIPAAVEASSHGMILISPWSTNPSTTLDDSGNWRKGIYRACFTDDRQAPALARFSRDTLGASTAWIVAGEAAVLQGQADSFASSFAARGGTVAGRSLLPASADYTALVNTIIAAKPAAVFVPAYADEATRFVGQYRQAGGDAPLLGSDAWDDPEALLTAAGITTQKVYSSAHYSRESGMAGASTFANSYKSAYGAYPTDVAALTWDSVNLLADAAHRANNTSTASVITALSATQSFAGITGSITLKDGKGTPVNKPVIVLQNVDGKMHFLSSVVP